ncbi:MAG: GNAT family N-acetyltransferase [Cardiobacteriaceae bacterium]|nr:GNAT family N-acetyltransferase [Cardiobacteriaceae bacterium]
MKLSLAPYQKGHSNALDYCLDAVQSTYTRIPAQWLQSSDLIPEQHPITILYEQTPIGFFILDKSEHKRAYTDNPHALLFRSMSINPSRQGRGLAKETLKTARLRTFIATHLPDADEIVLGVYPQNTAALARYLASGFHDTGRTLMGRSGIQHILSQSLCVV